MQLRRVEDELLGWASTLPPSSRVGKFVDAFIKKVIGQILGDEPHWHGTSFSNSLTILPVAAVVSVKNDPLTLPDVGKISSGNVEQMEAK
jgi:hypothetical protein